MLLNKINKKRKNKQNLKRMMEMITQSPYVASVVLLNQQKQKDGYYVPDTKSVATKPNASTFKTCYGSVTLSLVVDDDVTAVNIAENEIFSNHAVCKHLVINTDDCIKTLALI